MKNAIKDLGRSLVRPIAVTLAALGVSPNHLTVLGLLLSVVAGALLAAGSFRAAAIVLVLSGLCDMLDGAVARESNQSTRFGAFFDSTVDRVAELAVFAGLVAYFTTRSPSSLYAVLSLLAAGGSFLVSYARARAEGLNIPCSVGWMERPERLVLLIAAFLIGPAAVRPALWLLTALVFWTSTQRILHVREETGSL